MVLRYRLYQTQTKPMPRMLTATGLNPVEAAEDILSFHQ
jgi:hypothetical protein